MTPQVLRGRAVRHCREDIGGPRAGRSQDRRSGRHAVRELALAGSPSGGMLKDAITDVIRWRLLTKPPCRGAGIVARMGGLAEAMVRVLRA
jgi:hypothetical protein